MICCGRVAAGAGASGLPMRGTAAHRLSRVREVFAGCDPNARGEAYERRKAEIRKLTSAAAIHERQRWARETFWKIAGGMPDRTPLKRRTTGAFERERYRVEKLVYESRPDEWISANLYIPKNGTAPFPGVLFHMGHSGNGKAGGYLPALLPGAGATRICGAGVRSDGPG